MAFSTLGICASSALLLPLVSTRGCSCHGDSLLGDLMHDGLHELWRQNWNVDWRRGAFREQIHRIQ